MKNIRWWMLVVLGAILALVISQGTFTAEEDGEIQSVTGVISVHERDAQGVVRTLFLAGTPQGDLLVADNGLAEEMKDYVGETVEAEGTIKASDVKGFQLMIYVHDFYVVDEEWDEEDPDDEDPSSDSVAAAQSVTDRS